VLSHFSVKAIFTTFYLLLAIVIKKKNRKDCILTIPFLTNAYKIYIEYCFSKKAFRVRPPSTRKARTHME